MFLWLPRHFAFTFFVGAVWLGRVKLDEFVEDFTLDVSGSSAAEVMPELGPTFDLVPLPTDEVRYSLLGYMAADVAAVVVLERTLRFIVSKLPSP